MIDHSAHLYNQLPLITEIRMEASAISDALKSAAVLPAGRLTTVHANVSASPSGSNDPPPSRVANCPTPTTTFRPANAIGTASVPEGSVVDVVVLLVLVDVVEARAAHPHVPPSSMQLLGSPPESVQDPPTTHGPTQAPA